jgi:hypothetical protein
VFSASSPPRKDQTISVEQLFARHGSPHYVKIDVEHYDQVILRALFAAGIRPPFISAESHSIEVFALLVAEGAYCAFKLVDGPSVATRYRDWPIETRRGTERQSFPHHSAGPFGDDIDGEWMTAFNFARLLSFEGLGWKDIHASNVRIADESNAVDLWPYFVKIAMRKIAKFVPSPLLQPIRRILGR